MANLISDPPVPVARASVAESLEKQERDLIHSDRASHGDDPRAHHPPHHHLGDDRPEAVIHGSPAPRLADLESWPDFISDPHSTASSAAPHAPHVRKSPVPEGHQSEVMELHEKEKHLPHIPSEREKKHDAAVEAAEATIAESKKRKKADSDTAADDDEDEKKTSAASADRPMCEYGADCYRTGKQHLLEFRHPTKKVKKEE